MDRRAFIGVAGGSILVGPLVAEAQRAEKILLPRHHRQVVLLVIGDLAFGRLEHPVAADVWGGRETGADA